MQQRPSHLPSARRKQRLPDSPALLARLERLIRVSGLAPSAIGRMVLKDPALVSDMRRGRQLRPSTLVKLDAWIKRQEAYNA